MFKNLFAELPKNKTVIYFLLLIAVGTFTYSNHFGNSFHFDDSHTIQNNLYIQDLKNIPLFFKDGSTFSSLPQNQTYRPVVSTSLALDYWMGKGYDVFYFHLSSFILFLLQGILMFFLIFKIFNISYRNEWNFYIAAGAVAWYILHPANAETINYIIARSDLQSTFFVILGFVLYIFSPFCKRNYLYLIPIIIGALAKPPAIMFAPMLFFYNVLFEQRMSLYDLFKTQKVWQAIKIVIPAFIICVVMYLWIGKLTPKTWTSGGSSTFTFLISQPFVILHYFTTFFLPFGLSADTDWQPITTIMNIKFFIGMAFIAVMVFIAFLTSKEARLRPISFGIIWFFLALIPSSSVIPFAEILNDHRIFFPYVGLVISVSWAIGLFLLKYKQQYESSFKNFPAIVLATVLLLLSGYAYGVRQRNEVWKTEETLWKDVTIKSPNNARGLMNYGLSQMAKGNYPEAEKYFMQALGMWPTYPFLHINLGVLKEAVGDKITAENYFKSGIQYGENYPDAWYFYGRFLCNQQRYPEAVSVLSKSLELSPGHIEARKLLMKAYNETNDWDKLNEVATSTLQIIPGDAEATTYLEASKKRTGKIDLLEQDAKAAPTPEKYLNLSLLQYQKGNYQGCIDAAIEAIKLKPDFVEAYNNIGSAYNMLKDYDKSIAACQKALDINPNYTLAKNNLLLALKNKEGISKQESLTVKSPTAENYLNLSLTYYQQAQYEKSIEACQNAIKLKPDYTDAYSNMGAAYVMLKQYDKAIAACNKALKIDPTHKLANGNLNWALNEKKKDHH